MRESDIGSTGVELGGALSTAQRSIWAHDQLFPGSTTYHLAYAADISGPLQPENWRRAALRLAADQPAQRTTIVVGPDGVPRQVVADEVPDRICTIVDARDLSDDEFEDRLREELRSPFDLANGPLYFAVIFIRADDHHVLLARTHHIVSDQWSLGVWLDSVGRIHALESGWPAKAPRRPRRSPVELAGVEAEWLATDEAKAELEWWIERWQRDQRSPLVLPGGDASAPEDREVQANRALDTETTNRLVELAESTDQSLSDQLLAALAVVTSRYGSSGPVAVGSLRARRGLSNARTMGMFVNEVLLRLSVEEGDDFPDLVERVTAEAAQAGDHDRVPAIEIAAALRAERTAQLDDGSLFDVMYGWQASAGGSNGDLISALSIDGLRHEAEVHGLRVTSRPLPRPAR